MKNNKITILGYGRSGVAAAKLAKHIGFDVFVSDSRNVITDLSKSRYRYELGGHTQKIYKSFRRPYYFGYRKNITAGWDY